MALSQTHFQNAHNFTVNGGQFFSIAHANGMVIGNASDDDHVSTTLWQHVAPGAIFDSAERFPPAKCHPGTRERVIEKIVYWIDHPTPAQRILWIYGSAGSGKSALAHTICERYITKCGGSFFFARGPTDRGKAFKLFVSLSYQLAVQFPSMRALLNEALYHDPSLPTKSMEVQLFSLIIQPLLRGQPFQDHSPILIIDGLDECADDDEGMDTQCTIITLISQAIVKHNIPLRFLIVSRPEFWIRDTFESSPLPSITLSLSLRDDIDADKDIYAYLIDEFEKIRVNHKRTMASVTPPWPHTHIVDRFVYEASGQYIYASTLLKFVGKASKFSDPQEQLLILTSPGPHRALAFSELDRLYKTVISAYPRWETMKRVLGGILVRANSTIIEKVLDVEPKESILVMDALSPLINVEMPGPLSHYEQMLEPIYGSLISGRDEISLCHLSFREFLEDRTRSGALYVDIRDIAEEISRGFFGIVHRNIHQNYTTEPPILLNIGLGTYQHMMSVMISLCGKHLDNDTLRQLINATTHSLLLLDPDLEMKYFGYFMAEMDWIDFMLTLYNFNIARQRLFDQYFVAIPKDLIHAISEFRDVAFLAKQRCIHQLSCKRFRVMPTLAYLHEFHSASIDFIFNIGHPVADVLSVLQQHRHIIRIHHENTFTSPRLALSIVNLNDYPSQVRNAEDHDKSWLTRGEWKHHRIWLASEFLSIHLKKKPHQPFIPRSVGNIGENLAKFFMSRNLSDIHSREYFQNPCNKVILSSMIDLPLSRWTGQIAIRKRPWLSGFSSGIVTIPILCWFNRQLANPTTLRLLEDHDKSIVPKMRSTMNQIFEDIFLPVYRLPQADHHQECLAVQNYGFWGYSWRTFHDEVFGKTIGAWEGSPTIDRQRWHPHLACNLLNSLVNHLCRCMNHSIPLDKKTEHQEYQRKKQESFAYIVECLPYAETTQQNLDLIRAIAYLFPQVKLKWDPPIEFWSLCVEFLKKYDRSILSEEELDVLEGWLYEIFAEREQSLQVSAV